MVRIKCLLIALFIGVMSIVMDARAEGQKVLESSSAVDKVMVYSDRALVTREAKLGNLSAGLYDVVIKELPLRLQDDSVRVTSSDPNNLKIIGLDIKTYQLEKSSEDKIRSLQEQIQELEDNIRIINDNLTVLQIEKNYLNNAKDTFLKSALQVPEPAKDTQKPTGLPRLSIKDYDEMLSYYLGKLKTNIESIRTTELKLREVEKKLNFAKSQLPLLGASQSAIVQKKSVRVSVEVLKESAFNLALSYINYGVRWQASHDVRILYETKEMEITSYGMVSQNSGEDWMNAELSFSTAQPALQGWLPELPPLYVNLPVYHTGTLKDQNYQALASNTIAQPQQIALRREVMGDLKTKSDDKPADNLANQYLPSDASSNYGSMVFRTPKRVDIVSDGAAHRTSLWQQKFPIRFEYITTPKISPYAYLRALGTNKMAFPILRGNINVFMGSDFIGTSQTTSILPDEEFELTLNVDDNIRVTRKLEEKEEKGPGFLGSTKKVTYSFMIKIENYKKENAIITIVDQIPVTQNKDITVEFDKYSDKPMEEGKDGKLKWKFELKPKEIKELTFSFSVNVPKDKEPSFSNAPLQMQSEQQLRMKKK
ncbi:MAG: mucoidy inhibitor MuiA family protein [Planctomycetota bacterium]